MEDEKGLEMPMDSNPNGEDTSQEDNRGGKGLEMPMKGEKDLEMPTEGEKGLEMPMKGEKGDAHGHKPPRGRPFPTWVSRWQSRTAHPIGRSRSTRPTPRAAPSSC